MHIRKEKHEAKKINIFKDLYLYRDTFTKEQVCVNKTQVTKPGKKHHHHFIIKSKHIDEWPGHKIYERRTSTEIIEPIGIPLRPIIIQVGIRPVELGIGVINQKEKKMIKIKTIEQLL